MSASSSARSAPSRQPPTSAAMRADRSGGLGRPPSHRSASSRRGANCHTACARSHIGVDTKIPSQSMNAVARLRRTRCCAALWVCRVLSRVIRSRIFAGQRPAHGGKSRDLTDGGPYVPVAHDLARSDGLGPSAKPVPRANPAQNQARLKIVAAPDHDELIVKPHRPFSLEVDDGVEIADDFRLVIIPQARRTGICTVRAPIRQIRCGAASDYPAAAGLTLGLVHSADVEFTGGNWRLDAACNAERAPVNVVAAGDDTQVRLTCNLPIGSLRTTGDHAFSLRWTKDEGSNISGRESVASRGPARGTGHRSSPSMTSGRRSMSPRAQDTSLT